MCRRGFWLFLFCSVFIHVLLMVVLPDFLGNDSGLILIQLLASRDLQLDVLSEQRPHPYAEPDQQKQESTSQDAALDPTLLKRKMAELSLGESLKTPSPSVPAPPTSAKTSQSERIRQMAASPFYRKLARKFAESRRLRGYDYSGMNSPIDVSPGRLKDETVRSDPGADRILSQLRSLDPGPSPPQGVPIKPGIVGPAAQRELTFAPLAPVVTGDGEAEVEMKFWIQPDGTVGRAVPMKESGNPELKKMATNYLRQWRFRALPESEPQVETWGTVTIRFESE